jgi:Ca-activated chloride channel homolog
MSFSHQWYLLLGLLAPGLVAVLFLGRWVRRRRLARFIAARLEGVLVRSDNRVREIVRMAVLAISVLFLAAALARPLLDEREEEVSRLGVDFLVAVDVSNSMLARDVPPDRDRLAAARRAVLELVGKSPGDRIGVIAFAGEARLLAPLSFNTSTLRLVLNDLSPRRVWRQGTNLSSAIKVAADKLRREELQSRVLVILSDGDDLEGDAVMEARQAKVIRW